jgi:hypothetical protein
VHGSHLVFIGRLQLQPDGDLLWTRDPALPDAVTKPVVEAARSALRGFTTAGGALPGPVALVMLGADMAGDGFHGDRAEERMIRLSFKRGAAVPKPGYVQDTTAFVAHEMAHLWNRGAHRSDVRASWLHEGDAEWASSLVLSQAASMPACWRVASIRRPACAPSGGRVTTHKPAALRCNCCRGRCSIAAIRRCRRCVRGVTCTVPTPT